MYTQKKGNLTIDDLLVKWYIRGKARRERSRAIWVVLLTLGTVLFTMVAGIVYALLRPKINWSVPIGVVLVGAALLWVVFMLMLHRSTRRKSTIDLFSFQDGVLTVFLFDRTMNVYRLSDVTIDACQVKNFRTGSPAYTERFTVTITHCGTPNKYDILVDDAREFKDLIARLRRLPSY